MAKIVPVGYVDFVLQITRAGDPDPYVVTFGGNIDSPPFTTADAQTVADAAATNLAGAMQDVDTLTGLTAYVANDGPPLIFEIPMDTEGTNGGEALPQNVAAIITKSTGLGGRWNKGRMFWPSLIEGAVGPTGVLTPAYVTDLHARFNAFRGDTLAGGAGGPLSDWVIFHDESLAIEPTPIAELLVETTVGTQRRRLRR